MHRPHLLIVDDEPDLRWVLRGLFEDAGFTVAEAGDGDEALAAVARQAPHVVLSDVRMPKRSGIELLRSLQANDPHLPVVLLSAVEDLASAVSAIKEGAFDYQAKPFDAERLVLSVRRAAEQRALRDELQKLRRERSGAPGDFGPSPASQALRSTLQMLATQPSVAVLITGESGTGKEVVAKTIHAWSPLAKGPFVAVDCGALPEPLLESQLFGHERGAFTGADRARPGLFTMADGGTLFLDELGNLPSPLQAKLLRALQERAVTPVGGTTPVPFRARLLAATNTDLMAAVRRGAFRIDLYHRLAEFTVALPPLRERPDDVLHFARQFLDEANLDLGRSIAGFTVAAARVLCQYDWPGNLRELRNSVRRAALVVTAREIDAADLAWLEAPSLQRTTAPIDGSEAPLAERLRAATETLEAEILTTTLAACDGNKAAAARALRIDYTTLHRKLKRLGLL